MRLVVDASVAVKWLADEEGSERARRLLRPGLELHAPRLLLAEAANALRRKANKREIDPDTMAERFGRLFKTGIVWSAADVVEGDALEMAYLANHPIYDFTYFSLAVRVGAQLVTADKRFVKALRAWSLDGPAGVAVALDEFDPAAARVPALG